MSRNIRGGGGRKVPHIPICSLKAAAHLFECVWLLIGFFPNMAWELFFTNGRHASTHLPPLYSSFFKFCQKWHKMNPPPPQLTPSLEDATYFMTAKTLPVDTHLFTVPTLTTTYKTEIISYSAYLLLQTVLPSLPPPIESPSP